MRVKDYKSLKVKLEKWISCNFNNGIALLDYQIFSFYDSYKRWKNKLTLSHKVNCSPKTGFCMKLIEGQLWLLFMKVHIGTQSRLGQLCCCLVPKSCLPLLQPHSLSGSSVHGISQARILEWVTISSSRGSSWSRDQTHISCLAGGFFTTEPPGKPSKAMLIQDTNLGPLTPEARIIPLDQWA